MRAVCNAVSLGGMHKSSLHILILGLTGQEHTSLISDVERLDHAVFLNREPIKGSGLKAVVQGKAIDAVFIKTKSGAIPSALSSALKKNNPDCIVVELVQSPIDLSDSGSVGALQKCRVIFDRGRSEFHLAIQFVLQYTRLKIDFRRCKSLLYLSETRASRLVNSSSLAIAYLYQGKILHANIPFLVLFKADSIEEIQRFSLLKLIDPDEREVFANYLAEVRQAPHLNAELSLSLKRITGIPFYGKVNISPTVVRGRQCYQMWVQELSQDSKPEVIPVAKSMNVWDMPEQSEEAIQVNPFDPVISPPKKSRQETRVDVLLDALQHDEVVKLRFRELYISGKGALNHVLVDLDVLPDEFKKVNALLAKMPEMTPSPTVYGHFWDRLLLRMLGDELFHEGNSGRVYLLTLSSSMISDVESVMYLYKMLKHLQSKRIQLMLLVDAQIPMDRIPKIQKTIQLLRSSGCKIALNNFSVDTTPLFLYRRIQPEAVLLDSGWLDVLKEKKDGHAFLIKFVQQIEGRGVSVIIPHAIQKSNDRLLILSGASFGQEKPTQDCA